MGLRIFILMFFLAAPPAFLHLSGHETIHLFNKNTTQLPVNDTNHAISFSSCTLFIMEEPESVRYFFMAIKTDKDDLNKGLFPPRIKSTLFTSNHFFHKFLKSNFHRLHLNYFELDIPPPAF